MLILTSLVPNQSSNYNNYNLNKGNKAILLFSIISQKAAPHDYDLWQKGKTPGECPAHPGFLHEATFWITDKDRKAQAEHSECTELRRVELRYCC